MRWNLSLIVTVLLSSACAAQEEAARPELGRVGWGRDLDAALATSRGDGRPVLVLFQEVPG